MKITVNYKALFCPVCGAPELNPHDTGKPLLEQRWCLRPYKVELDGHWWSQCLRCSGGYSADLSVYTHANHNPAKGWF